MSDTLSNTLGSSDRLSTHVPLSSPAKLGVIGTQFSMLGQTYSALEPAENLDTGAAPLTTQNPDAPAVQAPGGDSPGGGAGDGGSGAGGGVGDGGTGGGGGEGDGGDGGPGGPAGDGGAY